MDYSKRITNDNIVRLHENEVFVFGSNQAGRHGAGAARLALTWGAKYGVGVGLQGKTYAIPTVNTSISNSLPVNKIKSYVDDFIEFAKQHPELKFFVTEIGCGLAGLKPKDVAPLFFQRRPPPLH